MAVVAALSAAVVLSAAPADADDASPPTAEETAGDAVLGQPAPDPSPSPSMSVTADFLALPAYDLEFAGAPPTSIRIGDRLTLEATHFKSGPGSAPSGALRLELPPGSSSLDDLGWQLGSAAVQAGATPAPSSTPGSSSALTVSVTPLKLGRLTLPSMVIQSGAVAIGRTNPFTIEVQSGINPQDPKADEPVPARPPVELPFPWITVIGAGLLALVLLVGGGYLAWRRLRKPVVAEAAPIPVVPKLPADQIALTALSHLDAQGLVMRGAYKKHYFGVSEILKRYLGDRYQFDALESTSRELLISLQARGGMDASQFSRVKELLETLDRVKFTDFVPPTANGAEVLQAARGLVEATRQLEVASPIFAVPSAGSASGSGPASGPGPASGGPQ